MHKKNFTISCLFFCLVIIYPLALAKPVSWQQAMEQFANTDYQQLEQRPIAESFEFFGLASYYNAVNYYTVDSHGAAYLTSDELTLEKDQWLALVGRFNVLLIKQDNLSIVNQEGQVIIYNPELLANSIIKYSDKTQLSAIDPDLDELRYVHLWRWLAWLCKLVESTIEAINTHITGNWGWAIVVFAVILKLILLPVSIMTTRLQRRVSEVQSQLAPKLAEIKRQYDGEEAHKRLMAAHEAIGVSPFFTLKPMLGSFIQIPILVAVFNALGEMPQLVSAAFFWIDRLAYPDSLYSFTGSIPLFGSNISLLPFLMTAVTVFSTIIYTNPIAPKQEVKRQKFNLYAMALAFFILFYPFPAAMVLYWALANILQTIQQQVIKI